MKLFYHRIYLNSYSGQIKQLRSNQGREFIIDDIQSQFKELTTTREKFKNCTRRIFLYDRPTTANQSDD